MLKFHQIKLILRFFLLLIAFQSNEVSCRLDTLLSRLYDRAQLSNRPLIVILDNKYLKERVQRPNRQEVNPLLTSSDEVVHAEPPIITNKLTRRPRKSSRAPKLPKLKKKFNARDIQRDRIQSPIVKSLLRISNDLRCDARDECEDSCKVKFSGVKKRKCVITCQITYECKEEVQTCEEDECKSANSCDSGECEEQQAGSTKGYKISNEKVYCSNGRC